MAEMDTRCPLDFQIKIRADVVHNPLLVVPAGGLGDAQFLQNWRLRGQERLRNLGA